MFLFEASKKYPSPSPSSLPVFHPLLTRYSFLLALIGNACIAGYYLPYSIHFSEFMPLEFFSRENGQNMKILKVRHFRMIGNWPPTVTTVDVQSINTERASLSSFLISLRYFSFSIPQLGKSNCESESSTRSSPGACHLGV